MRGILGLLQIFAYSHTHISRRSEILPYVDLFLPMRQPLPLLTAWLVLVFSGIARGYQWPSPQYEALESFLWEGGDSRVGFPLSLLVTACRTRSDSPGSVGAQWLRFVSAFVRMVCVWERS
jgi:hypothetical protein